MRRAFLFIILFVLAGCGPGAEEPVDPQVARLLAEAQTFNEQGNAAAALTLADSAAVLAPDTPEVHFLRGRLYTQLARPAEAQQAYERVLALDPDYEGAWLNLGNAAFRQEQPREALRSYQREQATHPSAAVSLQMGRSYAQLGVADSARMAYEDALARDSTMATAHVRLGQLYRETGELDKALIHVQRGLALEPDNPNYQFIAGSIYNLQGDPEAAAEHLRQAVEAEPWNYWATYTLSQALLRLGQADEAAAVEAQAEKLRTDLEEVEHWRGYAEGNPDQFMLWVRYASVLRRIGNTEEAEKAEGVARALAPNYMAHAFADPATATEHRRATGLLASGRMQDAIEIYRALLRGNPQQPDLWVNLGVAYAAYGRIEQALQSWKAALRFDPNQALARSHLADLQGAFYADPDVPTSAPATSSDQPSGD